MASEEKIQLMPLGEIKPYEDAPFKVRLDENMEELVESIKENGVLVPTIARPHTDGGVEMLAGHRRLKACELTGLDKLPVIVKQNSNLGYIFVNRTFNCILIKKNMEVTIISQQILLNNLKKKRR